VQRWLTQLELRGHGIEAIGKGRLQASWRGEACGLLLQFTRYRHLALLAL
jgi:hypothetical protein